MGALPLMRVRVLCCMQAQMGAIYGGGTEEQILAIGQFFEATGAHAARHARDAS